MQGFISLRISYEVGITERKTLTLLENIDWEQKGLRKSSWIYQNKSTFVRKGEIHHWIWSIVYEVYSKEDYRNHKVADSSTFSESNH